MKSLKDMTYEEFCDWYWFGQGGGFASQGLLFKSDDPYALARTDYFDPVYSMQIDAWGMRSQEFYRLLPKTTYPAKGDSVQVIKSDPYVYGTTAALRVLSETTALFSSVDTDTPDVSDFDHIEPAYVDAPWKITMQALVKAGYQQPYKMTPEKRKAFQMEFFMQLLDRDLMNTCDDVSRATVESIDRIISCKAEADTSWIDAGDCDVWQTQGTKSVDRDGTTANDAQVDLPATEANRSLTLDMIDDIMAAAKKFSSREYFAIGNDDTINVIQKLIDPKGRVLEGEKEVEITRNGVNTRPGVGAGRIPVSTIKTNGLTIPVFSDPNDAVPVSGGAGNLYFVDIGHIELRNAMPITALKADISQMLLVGSPAELHDIVYGGQLIADRFNCHAAIKYIAKG